MLSLLAEGTDTIFGYPGGQVIPIYDTLYDFRDRINHILTRHEQGAVHAAQGFARVTGKVGVCMATSGPGATNLVTGITDAMLDSTPIVCITGQVPSTLLGTDAFQEADIISMTMPVSKWNYQVTRAAEIPAAIAKAFYIARSGRPGPVVVDITKNAQVELFDCDCKYDPCTSLRSYQPYKELDQRAIELLDQAVGMINDSRKPLMLIGQGIILSGAEKTLVEFAEASGIPVATTLMGISAVPNNHPLFVGNLGMHGNLSANEMTQQSDLLIAIGMRFSDRITGDVKTYAPNAKIIHIDLDESEIGKNLPVTLGIHADARKALELMIQKVEYRDRSEWLEVAGERNRFEYENVILPCIEHEGDYISMGEAIIALTEAEKSEAVIVTDVGQNQMFAARYSRFNNTRSFITSGGLGTMGFGLPAAMGAKVGLPDAEVVAILGDGGFQMTMQELGTIMQNRIGLKIVLLNNSYLGMVRQWQELFFDRRYSFTTLENPDFTVIAKAYGITAERVSNKKDLKAAMERLAAAEGAYFLEVEVCPEDNVFPMVPAGASLSNIICRKE